MKFFHDSWALLVQALDVITFSPWGDRNSAQHSVQQKPFPPPGRGPIFRPPNGPPDLQCDYLAMGGGWKECSTPQDRTCWLAGPSGDGFNITTDYETRTPKGITRRYWLNVTDQTINADGFKNLDGKVFNGTYPGPWIQACWGDNVEVTVTNHLKYNGTAVHWHGIRQLGTAEADGVNGVTQCPIAPGDSYTYKFKALQYGSSWLHSHYSLQYGDGVLAPLTIYGPSSAPYDEAVAPILISDWNHRSAFSDFHNELVPIGGGPPNMTSILLNGRGNYTCTRQEVSNGNCTTIPDRYTMTFQRGKKYLLRLINTSVGSTFIFAIDNHNLTIIGNDFVPITPYTKNHVLIGIGQRYHVVVDANPINSKENFFWIRVFLAVGCSRFNSPPQNTLGILRYSPLSLQTPTTTNATFSTLCADEPYESLRPIVPWQVGRPVDPQDTNTFQVGLNRPTKEFPTPHGNFSRWDIGANPLWLNFSDPTLLNLQTAILNPEYVVIPENYPSTSWVYLLITGGGFPFETDPKRNFIPAAHPIHLHGHDFVIVEQSSTPYWDGLTHPKFDNPPRRDVALLPANGYLVIAFKADNPGTWLLHCHIVWHASSGLALQILERSGSIVVSNETVTESNRVCRNWNTWFSDTKNYWNPSEFQEDSGI